MLTTLPTHPPEPVILTASGERRDAWRVVGRFRVVLPRVHGGGEGGAIASARGATDDDAHWIVAGPSFHVLPASGAVSVAEVEAAQERERLAIDAGRLMDVSGAAASKE